MHESEVADKLDAALDRFQRKPANVETGLEVDEPALLQLRKACRLLSAGETLLSENGYYTVVIESSFGAIERTLQFRLQETGSLSPEEYIDHETVYERAMSVGLYDRTFRDQLIELWGTYRSSIYYRERKGSEARARAMHELATSIHSFVVDLSSQSHNCICSE
jgi:hypothetical protein